MTVQPTESILGPPVGPAWDTTRLPLPRKRLDFHFLPILVTPGNQAHSISTSSLRSLRTKLINGSAFGNSLSYVTPNGDRVASESTPFDGTLETSEREIAVFSDKECDGDCPYWRPNATSHCESKSHEQIGLSLMYARWLVGVLKGILHRVSDGPLFESWY